MLVKFISNKIDNATLIIIKLKTTNAQIKILSFEMFLFSFLEGFLMNNAVVTHG